MEDTYTVVAKILPSPRSRLKGPLAAAYAAAGSRHGLGVNINVLSTTKVIRPKP